MKNKSLSLLTAIYCVVTNISAQEPRAFINALESEKTIWSYIPLLSESKQWNVLYENASLQKTTHVFRMNGDTIVENRKYTILSYSVDEQVNNWSQLGYLYEDTKEKKVYYRPAWGDKDGLLYDFSVETGDTVYTIGNSWYGQDKPNGDYWMTDSIINIVKKVDSIKLSNEYYKRITVVSKPLMPESENFTLENEWIEGIGNLKGVFSFNVMLSGTPNQTLLAYYQNDELIYQSPEHDSDFIWITVGNEHVEDNQSVSVLLHGKDLHVIKRLDEQPYLITLYSIHGMSLLQQKGNSSSTIVRLPNHLSGIYIVNISSGIRSVSKKIIIK